MKGLLPVSVLDKEKFPTLTTLIGQRPPLFGARAFLANGMKSRSDIFDKVCCERLSMRPIQRSDRSTFASSKSKTRKIQHSI